jgi:DNA-binding XRE family transcriptional regulator
MPHKHNIDGRIGGRLAEIRASRKISQAWLAQLIGVTPGAIQAYEHGRSRVTVDRLDARIVRCAPAHICDFKSWFR